MKSLVFCLSVLALMALVHTIPCIENICGGYSYMGAPSFGYANANMNAASGGGYEVGEENNGSGGDGYSGGGGGAGYNGDGGGAGYNGGGGGGNEGSGGEGYNGRGGPSNQGGGGNGYNGGNGGGYNGGGSGGYYGGGGGGYYGAGGGYRRRSSYCPNCYVKDFGNGIHNANTINIKHRRN